MAHNWFFVGGGADRVFFETMKLLEEHGHEVIPFSMKDKRNCDSLYKEYFVDEIDYSKIKFSLENLQTALKMIYSTEAKKKIDALIQKTRPDIAHLHNIYGRLTPSILYALKKNDVPVVMTLHDYKLICPTYNMLYNGKPCEECKGKNFYKAIKKRCNKNSYLASFVYSLESYIHTLLKTYIKNVEYFIVPSQFMKEKMTEYGVPENKLFYIPNFVYTDTEPVFQSDNYFLYSGKLLKIKGLFTLLKAMLSLNDSYLYIAGEGDMRHEIENYIKQNSMDKVKLLGHLNNEELLTVIKNAKFIILPTECYENAPMAVLEAFTCGKPVIGSRIGGIPEMVIDGETGLLFEPGDHVQLREKIEYLLANPNRIIEIGRNAREKVEKEYNPELHYQRLIELYQSAL